MSKLKIYGVPISRSISNIWAALELGIDYENVAIGWDDDSIYGEAYRRINPNARVPALKDGDFILWESLAINLYLVRKHGGDLAARTLEEEALAWQWTLWAAVHLERPLMQWAFHAYILDADERKAEVAAKALAEAQPLLKVLDGELGKKPYLAGERFTVADLNVGCVMLRPREKLDLTNFPSLAAWDKAVFGRPAAQQAWAIRVEAASRQ
ncbi:MAG: glutathione S-transferase family protein [Alphaproteobacteria bacterium]